MLKINIPGSDFFDEKEQRFITTEPTVLELEHSLVSLSKWESIWEKPFITDQEKTHEETISYIKLMTLTPDVPEDVYMFLTAEHYEQIRDYIEAKQTATWFSDHGPQTASKRIITNELIYYWMFTAGIDLDCQNWHLNRLFTLIKVHSAENAPKKKTSTRDLAAQRRAENARRLAALKTTG